MKGYQTKTNFSETKMSERQAQVIVSQLDPMTVCLSKMEVAINLCPA